MPLHAVEALPEPERARRVVPASPMPDGVARVLALQRGAGNQAVAGALAARRLQRLAIKGLAGQDLADYEQAEKLYKANFDDGAPLADWDQIEIFGVYLQAATTAGELLEEIRGLVKRAAAWRQREDEKKRQPAAAVPPRTIKKPGESRKTKKRKNPQEAPTTIVLGQGKYTPKPDTPDKPDKPAAAAPAVTPLPPQLKRFQDSLDSWTGGEHTGPDGTMLSLAEVNLIVAYCHAKWLARPFKGRGSGTQHGDAYQLKISELQQIGDKSATWHLDLTQRVFNDLQVPLATRSNTTR